MIKWRVSVMLVILAAAKGHLLAQPPYGDAILSSFEPVLSLTLKIPADDYSLPTMMVDVQANLISEGLGSRSINGDFICHHC
jgi:hypothetical protein